MTLTLSAAATTATSLTSSLTLALSTATASHLSLRTLSGVCVVWISLHHLTAAASTTTTRHSASADTALVVGISLHHLTATTASTATLVVGVSALHHLTATRHSSTATALTTLTTLPTPLRISKLNVKVLDGVDSLVHTTAKAEAETGVGFLARS